MFLSMNWISDFVDLSGLDKMDLIHRFSLSTAEVENDIFFKGSDIDGIVVAEIKSVENHPKSEKLHLLKVDIGEAELVDVVCGAVKALDGNMEKVSNSIFVVAPYNYDIVNEITKEKIESKFSASWIK